MRQDKQGESNQEEGLKVGGVGGDRERGRVRGMEGKG